MLRLDTCTGAHWPWGSARECGVDSIIQKIDEVLAGKPTAMH